MPLHWEGWGTGSGPEHHSCPRWHRAAQLQPGSCGVPPAALQHGGSTPEQPQGSGRGKIKVPARG